MREKEDNDEVFPFISRQSFSENYQSFTKAPAFEKFSAADKLVPKSFYREGLVLIIIRWTLLSQFAGFK